MPTLLLRCYYHVRIITEEMVIYVFEVFTGFKDPKDYTASTEQDQQYNPVLISIKDTSGPKESQI